MCKMEIRSNVRTNYWGISLLIGVLYVGIFDKVASEKKTVCRMTNVSILYIESV